MKHWNVYAPNSNQPWNLQRVVHLHRRVAFGASISEQVRDLKDGPQRAVSRLLKGESRIGTPDSFDELSDVIGRAAQHSANPDRLKAWWLYRCLFSPDPLKERLTLMWHNHFATSNLKIGDLHQMKNQNETLRLHSRDTYQVLLQTMIRDPALLQWLDAPTNRKGQPNENLARELLELFSVGIGNYTEGDVRQAARALTGWTVRKNRFEFRAEHHDESNKTILGRTGKWNGEDLASLLVEHPAVSRRLAWRLVDEFFGEDVVSSEALEDLASLLNGNGLDIASAVETILRSDLFFSESNINSRVCDPVSFVIGPLRTLDCIDPPPSTLLLADWLRRMGQDLFYPPNVGGWNGGRAWLSTRTIIARTNYVVALVEGRLHTPRRRPELKPFIAQRRDEQSELEFLAGSLGFSYDETGSVPTSGLRQMIVRLMTQPESHLH